VDLGYQCACPRDVLRPVAGDHQNFVLRWRCVVDDHLAEHGHFFRGDHDVADDLQNFVLHWRCVVDGRGPPDVHFLAVDCRSHALHREAVDHLMGALLRSVAFHQSPDGFPGPVAAQCEDVQTNVAEVLAQNILLRLQRPWVGGPCMDVRYQHAAADHRMPDVHDVVGDHLASAEADHQTPDVHGGVSDHRMMALIRNVSFRHYSGDHQILAAGTRDLAVRGERNLCLRYPCLGYVKPEQMCEAVRLERLRRQWVLDEQSLAVDPECRRALPVLDRALRDFDRALRVLDNDHRAHETCRHSFFWVPPCQCKEHWL
jgi:hypothetical protein